MSDPNISIDESISDGCNEKSDAAEYMNDGFEDEEDPGEDHEFEIIDQVESDDGGEDGKNGAGQREGGELGLGDDSSSDDLDDLELHAMLENGISKEALRKDDRSAPIVKQKIVLKEIETDPFDILPEGWVCVTHNCGMPVYLHKESRVCTMARPYSLGSASVRAHDIPLSAIPCLQYRRQLDKGKETENPPMLEVGIADKLPSEVSDLVQIATQTNGQKTAGPVQDEPDISTESANQIASLCPAQTAELKRTLQKLWLVSQETTQASCPLKDQGKMLHTGTEEFHRAEGHSIANAGDINISSGQSGSPEGDNIAVSLDSSSLETSCAELPPEKAGQRSDNGGATAGTGFVYHQPVEESTDHLVHVSLANTVLSGSFVSEESCGNIVKHNRVEEADSVEEGEIIDEQKAGVKAGSAEICTSAVHANHSVKNPEPGQNCSVCPGQQHAITAQAVKTGNVVLEEAAGSSEPSELVTSSSNSLASIKRKIESLKNKRAGKFRKVDNGSAVGWPTDNNIAVSPMKAVVGGSANAALTANANEKIKLQAAEVKIKSAEERAKESLLDSKVVHTYCSKLFQFRTLEVKKYRSWRERRRHIEERNRRNRPELPSSTTLITCPIPSNLRSEDGGDNAKKREFILNPTGKSYLCILHEYMQRTLKIQPMYVFRELENSKTPYGATVTIGNIEYGTGYASSKKVAKQEAAKETLKVLIPDLFKRMSDQEMKRNISDLSFFDEIKVNDPRVNDLGNKVGQPSPFQLLLECLRRNFGMGNTQCEVSTKPLKNQKCEFTINVGKHSATVVAKNKREGKQLAAQAVLAKLHPHVPSWGSLLRLYGTSVEKPIQKPEEISEAKSHAPNHSVLDSLREEMKKLHKLKEAIQPKGKIMINSRNLPSKMSSVDL